MDMAAKMTSSPLKKIKVDHVKDENPENPVSGSPLDILDVVAYLSKFVGYADLKSMRLVNKIWAEASGPRFCRKSVILLKTGEASNEQLENFAKETGKLKTIKNVRIFINSDAFPDAEEINLFNNILEIVSPSLQNMEICWDREVDVPIVLTPFFHFRESVQFPVLAQLKICNHEKIFEKNSVSSFQWLYRNAPNLQEMYFQTLDEAFLEVLVNSDGSRNWEFAPSLNGLTFEWIEDDDYGKDLYEILKNIEYLACFPQTFTKLDLNCFSIDKDNVIHLEKLLEVNKNSLTNLRLTWFATQRFGFKFPDVLPRLEKLDLMFSGICGNVDVNIGKWSVTCPSLTSLAIDVGSEAWMTVPRLENFFKTFFPNQICGSLRLLEFNFQLLYSKYLFNEGDENYWQDYFRKMFPRAKVRNVVFINELASC